MSEYARTIYEQKVREETGRLYEESGGDVTVCEFCLDPLDDSRPWMRGLDGAGGHIECIEAEGITPRSDDDEQ